MSLDELNLPKNNLFKLTCRDGYDSPNYTFTWELTPAGAAILQEKKVRFPFLYVFAVEEVPPKRVESHQEGCGCDTCTGYLKVVENQIFCLHEGAGQIQFHREGIFKIYAMVVWYDDDQAVNHTWRAHRCYILSRIERYRSRILGGLLHPSELSLDHVEEDAVQITSTFFAKKPNPTLWWWANLWWENKPRNSCDYKKRIWFVLWLQVITVSTYVFLRGVLMGVSYLVLLLIGFRPSSFSFRPMFHAFSSTFDQLCDFESKTSNWAFQDDSGECRKSTLAIVLRLPIIWILAPIGLSFLSYGIYIKPKAFMWAAILLASGAAGGFGLFLLLNKLKYRINSADAYYEVVSAEKPKKRRITPKVRWLDAKGKYCLPFQE